MFVRSRVHWFVAVLLAAAAVRLLALQGAPERRTVALPMRDGVKLSTDVYLPSGTGRFPVILLRTPYDKTAGGGIGADGARRGYAIVVQDVRGRFASSGRNLAFETDGWWGGTRDGEDTLEWLAQQPWCGKIGTFGGSALGITQLLAAGTGTRRIAAQYIQVGAPSAYHDIVFTGGSLRKALVEDWLRISKFDAAALGHWTAHPTFGAFWRERDLGPRYGSIHAPAVHMGGWYDIFGQGTIDAFQGYQLRGGQGARGQQKLVMGPWTHGILQDKAGDLTFPGGRAPGKVSDSWAWFDWRLKGVDTGFAKLPAVTYYTMGDVTDPSAPGNRWRTSDRWPPIATKTTAFYLRKDKLLAAAPASPGKLTYAYDPRDPVPSQGGPQLTIPAGPKDQTKVESRPDVLVFTSAPLTSPLEVTGRVKVRLAVSSDCRDTDFAAKLCDVYPDGRSYNVCEGILRARFRKGFDREVMLKPGVVEQLTVDLWSTSIVFNKGHRLRVQVTSSSAPAWDPNPNTGEPFRSSSATRVAHNAIHMGGAKGSCILLPVAPAP